MKIKEFVDANTVPELKNYLWNPYACGLQALRTATITSALPFCVIIVLMCWGIVRSLRTEKIPEP
ncbi:MAG: BCCT family transporter [Myxococcales bacterium]|nr:MAG: BCCT family transporter [Myxococcales bacterium]